MRSRACSRTECIEGRGERSNRVGICALTEGHLELLELGLTFRNLRLSQHVLVAVAAVCLLLEHLVLLRYLLESAVAVSCILISRLVQELRLKALDGSCLFGEVVHLAFALLTHATPAVPDGKPAAAALTEHLNHIESVDISPVLDVTVHQLDVEVSVHGKLLPLWH